MDMRLLSGLSIPTDTKMILLVMDGLGGLPHPETGLTELETARTPNLDALARGGDARADMGMGEHGERPRGHDVPRR